MTKYYILQQRNSVTGKWQTVLEGEPGDLQTVETRYHATVRDPRSLQYRHVFRWCEVTVMAISE